LAVWWTEFGDPGQRTAFRVALDEVYQRHLAHEIRDPAEVPLAMRTDVSTERLT
jgi:hypothetical protein